MVREAPLWTVLVLPVVLGALALAAAALHAGLAARAAGRPVAAELTTPLYAAARLLVRQRRRIPRADLVLWRAGLAGIVVAALLAAMVVPLGEHVVADLSAGVVWFNAMEVLLWMLVWLVGWGANSAFALVGGYRFLAQALAYELPLMFALTAPPLAAASLRVGDVVRAQDGLWFAVWMPAAFAVYLVGIVGVAFWGPLANPVGGDIAGGASVEVSGVDALVLRAGRYLMLAAGAAFAVPLFLGGGMGPLLPPWLWSLVKTAAVLAVLVWLRHRLPRLPVERLMTWGWTVLLPLVLAQLLVVGVVVVR
ncbi:NADH-quinone oxidoreductase subunit H [Amycolatopsis arida]|uniref:NADH-quinone oxidoreductase subunit H n=1 Tax=Amycolatopsis arida TaxID=587909 RepID=A0A1I6ATW2_9PSEU|nr:complex I subunit 1 family protein [Amycolatopsis arida]TDX97519.1 NADH-quinone oxidoreductase subunit H [Amycolatopsis arida]SFQ72134.1 NADH-quinone oxidoreductase subunit H [Amycolatopsis arida]